MRCGKILISRWNMKAWLKKMGRLVRKISYGIGAVAVAAVLWGSAGASGAVHQGVAESELSLNRPTKRLVLKVGPGMIADTDKQLDVGHSSHVSHYSHYSHRSHYSHYSSY